METSTISRRELLKGTGALVVSFSLFGPAARALAQAAAGGGEPEAASLDSWLAIAQDGTVTVFTSKVELGTGTETGRALQPDSHGGGGHVEERGPGGHGCQQNHRTSGAAVAASRGSGTTRASAAGFGAAKYSR